MYSGAQLACGIGNNTIAFHTAEMNTLLQFRTTIADFLRPSLTWSCLNIPRPDLPGFGSSKTKALMSVSHVFNFCKLYNALSFPPRSDVVSGGERTVQWRGAYPACSPTARLVTDLLPGSSGLGASRPRNSRNSPVNHGGVGNWECSYRTTQQLLENQNFHQTILSPQT